jgi:hypothetical protein
LTREDVTSTSKRVRARTIIIMDEERVGILMSISPAIIWDMVLRTFAGGGGGVEVAGG